VNKAKTRRNSDNAVYIIIMILNWLWVMQLII